MDNRMLTDYERPIIFIGHSLGCLIIKKVSVELETVLYSFITFLLEIGTYGLQSNGHVSSNLCYCTP